MKAIRVRTHLDSDTVRIPELAGMVGKDVEITVAEAVHARVVRPATKPVKDIRELMGRWPGDVNDGFEEWYRAERHRQEPRVFRTLAE